MIEILEEKEFNEFAMNHKNSIFFQSSYWGKLKSSTGWKYYLTGMKEDGKIIGVSLLLAKKIPVFNKYIFYSPRGFLIDYTNLKLVEKYSKEMIKFVKKNNGIFIKINPLEIYQERDLNGDIIEDGFNNKELFNTLINLGFKHTGFTINYGKDLEPRWLSVLNIKEKTEEELLKNMRSTTRWSINNSYKNSLRVFDAKEKDLSKFKDLMKHTSERRGFIDRPLSYYKTMFNLFNEDSKIKVLLVEFDIEDQTKKYNEDISKLNNRLEKIKEHKNKENQIKEFTSQIESYNKKIRELNNLKNEYGNKVTIAGGLYMLFGKQVVYLFGASLKPFMKFNSQYLLEWEVIKYARENNYEKFNFYGITGEFNEDSPMYGLFDFKRGFGAEVNELIGEFTYITDKFYYNVYNIMFKVYRKLKKVMK